MALLVHVTRHLQCPQQHCNTVAEQMSTSSTSTPTSSTTDAVRSPEVQPRLRRKTHSHCWQCIDFNEQRPGQPHCIPRQTGRL
eukprot:4897963-Amphidinium_carterae.1